MENQESPQVFDANWFTNKLESSIANLRGRFSAELNIPVEQEIILEYLVSPEYYRSSVKVLSCAVQESIKKVKPNYTEISADIRCDENSMRCFLEKLILECENAIIDSEAESSISLRSAKRIFGEYISELKKTKEYAAVLSAPMVLITGTAGIGKSHFIAHCAKKHIEKGGAGVLILGNLLNESYPLCTQIMNCLNIKCIDGFLSDLNTLGAKFGKRSIIFIDALNEAGKRCLTEIHELLKIIEKYPDVGVMISLRSNVAEKAEKELIKIHYMTNVPLSGFKNMQEAVKMFFNYYNIPVHANYYYQRILQTPLMLKIYCDSYENSKNQPLYLVSIMNNYINSINEKLCEKVGLSPKIKEAKKLLDAFVQIILQSSSQTLKREVPYECLAEKLGNEKSKYIDELISLNVLSVFTKEIDGDPQYMLYFEYEFIGDYFIADGLLNTLGVEKFENREQLRQIFTAENKYFNIIEELNIIAMLSILLPDRVCSYDKSGFEIFNWNYSKFDSYIFYDSLIFRNPEKINVPISYSYLINNEFHFYTPRFRYDLFSTILELCMNKNHGYNIKFLKESFSKWRDACFHREWTIFVSNKLQGRDIFNFIINTALNLKHGIDEEQKFLLGITLAWCLISLSDEIANKCSEALFKMYSEELSGLVQVIEYFCDIDRCKVSVIVEKLFLVAMHCTFISKDSYGKIKLAKFIKNNSYLYSDYFMIHEYSDYILDYCCNNALIEKASFSDIKFYGKFEIADDFDVKTLYKQKISPNDYDETDFNLISNNENEYECEIDDYYKCYNQAGQPHEKINCEQEAISDLY